MSTSSVERKGRNTKVSEKDTLDYLREGPAYGPVRLSLVSEQQPYGQPGSTPRGICDAIVEMSWRGGTARYAVEIRTTSQPAAVEQAAFQAQRAAGGLDVLPMVFVPYLSEEALGRLEERNVSGIDLCGNCVILSPSKDIWRSVAPNRFRESRPIRNPYSGDSSIIARCFLLRAEYRSLTELREFALSRTIPDRAETEAVLRLGTVSKVVQALQDELIVAKDQEGVRLVARQRLLDRLRERYRPAGCPRLVGKTPLTPEEVWARLAEASDAGKIRYAATGMASAGWYGVLAGVERTSMYVDNLAAASELLSVTEGRAFANIELIETRRNLAFFDCREDGAIRWASAIQTWLELAQGGAREWEAAQDLARLCLEGSAEETK